MTDRITLAEMASFITADGSAIRELAGPQPGSADSRHQSLAEATVPPGGQTAEHYHPRAEEIYHFTSGAGRMRLNGDEFAVAAGDCVVIAPGAPHQLVNDDAEQPLTLLCCCAPPYSDDDTVMTGG